MSHQELDLAALLHKHGYRMTPQRQMVLDAVCEADGHATPEEVYEIVHQKSRAVNRATVYRTLKLLRDIEAITAVTLPDGHLQYEIFGTSRHHHLICRRCGYDLEFSDQVLQRLLRLIEDEYKFRIDINHMALHGLCSACQ